MQYHSMQIDSRKTEMDFSSENRPTHFKVKAKLYVLYWDMDYSCYTQVSLTVSSAVARLGIP